MSRLRNLEVASQTTPPKCPVASQALRSFDGYSFACVNDVLVCVNVKWYCILNSKCRSPRPHSGVPPRAGGRTAGRPPFGRGSAEGHGVTK